MNLLLRRDISKVGLAGDIVEVKQGYARNYLIPQHLGVEPTPANLKAVEEDKRQAEKKRRRVRGALEERVARLREVEVTIAAVCNPEGHLYGSVGPREIAAALRDEGHEVETKQINLQEPIRQLDSVAVPVVFADDLSVDVKVWVVRETGGDDLDDQLDSDEAASTDAGRETGDEYGTGIDALESDL